MKTLLKVIDFYQGVMRSIQVVGTNGKGSTVAFVESILRSHDVSTGLFTSPHLCSARERIRINGKMVSEKEFCEASDYVLKEAEAMDDEPSFFECMLAMALWLFKTHEVEVAILEAGIGGRLDATTAVSSDVLGITAIDIDHQAILGTTIEEIATEKVMAARPWQTVVTVEQMPKAQDSIERAQEEIGFRLVFASPCETPLGLFGAHQKANAGLALELIKELHLPLDEKKTAQGLLSVNWPGRFEIIPHEVDIVLDGAHNPSGILALVHCLKEHASFQSRPLILVYGSLKSEHAKDKIALLMKSGVLFKSIFLHEPMNPRAYTVPELESLFLEVETKAPIHAFADWPKIIEEAKKMNAAVVVCGSLYTVGEMRSLLLSIKMDPKGPSF